jgi:S-(hydroxymethyl)glutathione dehydrogenase/alcohol dehydrogenase
MRASVLTALNRRLALWDLEAPPLGAGELRVRVLASGVCGSDLHRLTGAIPATLPIVLGHEACAVVVAAGAAVTAIAVGDRVVTTSNPECGRCWFCVNGQPNLCDTTAALRDRIAGYGPDGIRVGAMAGLGSFREEMNVDQTMLVKVETELPDEELALLGCGVMTGLGAVLNTARVEPGATVAVIGCGGVGLAAIQGSRIAAASRIVAIDPIASKREAALALGATEAIDPNAQDAVASVLGATGGRGADYAFEMVGSVPTILQARAMTRRGGTTVLVGAAPKSATVTFSAWDLHTEGRILGCSNGSAHVHRDVPRFIALAEAGTLDLGAMVTRRIGLGELDEAFEMMQRSDTVRTVVVP